MDLAADRKNAGPPQGRSAGRAEGGTDPAPTSPHRPATSSEPLHDKIRRIKQEVAEKHGVTVADLEGPSRRPACARPRHELMWRLRRETPLSYPAIGRRLGGRHHTTVLNGVRLHQRGLDELPA